jgi:hypothetical protein
VAVLFLTKELRAEGRFLRQQIVVAARLTLEIRCTFLKISTQT